MIVTTPEKWDVVTRKATGDVQLAQIVRLLIIDEIHLLHEDRGAVIESLVARTLRQVNIRKLNVFTKLFSKYLLISKYTCYGIQPLHMYIHVHSRQVALPKLRLFFEK